MFRGILLALAAAFVPSVATAQVFSGAQPDQLATGTLDLSAVDNTYAVTIINGQGVACMDVTGLTGSGATIIAERSSGSIWTQVNMLVPGSGGAFTLSLTADTSFCINIAARRWARLRVMVAGSGAATVMSSMSNNSSIVQIGASLPPGGNALGSVSVSNLPASQPVTGTFWQATQPISGSVAASQSGAWTVGITGTPAVTISGTPSVNISNFPASQVVTGTFWQATQPVSLASTITASDVPSSAAASAISPVTTTGATSLLVKGSAGNFYSATASAGTSSGYFIVANLAAVPSSGTSLTGAGVLLFCIPVDAGRLASVGNPAPDRASAGVVLLFSTGCTTYTPPANAAAFLRGRAM